jgi:DivIVA domain-containing protein
MTLTADDVQNKEFLTVRLREGYDMQEVDAFLDEVETELRRLHAENERLTAELEQAREGILASPEAAAAAAAGVTETGLQRAVTEPSQAPQAALTILTHAQTAADNLLSEAQTQADELVSAATERARALDEETETRRAELLGVLERDEMALRDTIDELQAHEREYRSRLLAFHEAQARKLREGGVQLGSAAGSPNAAEERPSGEAAPAGEEAPPVEEAPSGEAEKPDSATEGSEQV